MKNSVLVYQTNKDNIFNIGDYIQSLAAAQFFGNSIDICVNREHLDKYSGEDIKVIMNGWFMHEPLNWPPSPKIHPLFISFHLNSLAKEVMLREDSLSYFKKNEPIGCRDKDTVSLLQSKGINAYFSGCLTLTLSQSYKDNSSPKKGIYFTDPYYDISKNFFSILYKYIILMKNFKNISLISTKLIGNKKIKSLILSSFFYSSYTKYFTDDVLINAEYIKHEIQNTFNSEVEKFEYAKLLLKKYSSAKLVVTSRIHCALPCLALETPVIYVENINQSEVSSCRLNGIKQLFNIITSNNGILNAEFIKEKITNSYNINNKNDYKYLQKHLTNICKYFIENK